MVLTRKTTSVNSLNLVYFEGGKGEPLVFIPGWGAHAETYNGLLDILVKRYHVYVPEVPGFGRSSTPDIIWSIHEYSDFFNEWLRNIILNDLIIIGHSLSGSFALCIADKNQHVKEIVLIDPYGLPMEQGYLQLVKGYLQELMRESTEGLRVSANKQAFISTFYNLKNIGYVLPFSIRVFNRHLKASDSL